jgi:hypothetical protein
VRSIISGGEVGIGGVVAEGTAQAPILFSVSDPRTQDWQGMTAYSLKHVTVENASQGVSFASTTVPIIEDSLFVQRVSFSPLGCAQVNLFTPSGAGHMLRSHVVGYGGQNCSAVLAAAALGATLTVEAQIIDSIGDGLQLVNASVRNCDIHGSGRHGVLVPFIPSGSVPAGSVLGCNLGPNAGDGIFNQSGETVDARGNWWGDVNGPFGPAGDGLTGHVDETGWLVTPATLGY